MENVSSNFNAIKSPAPNVVSSEKKPQKRTIKRPNVGVVNPSKISQTPITDNLVMKKNENPRTIYKLNTKKYKALDLNNTISLFILGLGACTIAPYGKHIFNFLKKNIPELIKKIAKK